MRKYRLFPISGGEDDLKLFLLNLLRSGSMPVEGNDRDGRYRESQHKHSTCSTCPSQEPSRVS